MRIPRALALTASVDAPLSPSESLERAPLGNATAGNVDPKAVGDVVPSPDDVGRNPGSMSLGELPTTARRRGRRPHPPRTLFEAWLLEISGAKSVAEMHKSGLVTDATLLLHLRGGSIRHATLSRILGRFNRSFTEAYAKIAESHRANAANPAIAKLRAEYRAELARRADARARVEADRLRLDDERQDRAIAEGREQIRASMARSAYVVAPADLFENEAGE